MGSPREVNSRGHLGGILESSLGDPSQPRLRVLGLKLPRPRIPKEVYLDQRVFRPGYPDLYP